MRNQKSLVIGILIIFLLILTGCSEYNNQFNPNNQEDSSIKNRIIRDNDGNYQCVDDTFHNKCSISKPLFCFNGTLINRSSICGCENWFEAYMNDCVLSVFFNNSDLYNEPKIISYTFTRNLTVGKREEVQFKTYKGVNDYLEGIDRNIWYYPSIDPMPTEKDYLLKNIDNPTHKYFLSSLVEDIKKLSSNRDEQARIAISIVQMIPYDTFKFKNNITTRKYAYEVLYTYTGVCDEKSKLIIYLLRELGYGTAYMVFEDENHATAAIKCPVNYSYRNTGWCFIEATDIALIGQSNNDYVDVGKLSYNPKIYPISDGYEYQDIIKQVEDTKIEETKGTRFRLTDKSGAVILRKVGDIDTLNTYGDIIIKYPD